MPRRSCVYWTRKLELRLVNFVKKNDVLWKPMGNTNYLIQQKYKAYAVFASQLGGKFTARSVRDRWVNIRSTFHHNLRKVEKSKLTANSPSEVYVPCWPLWKPLHFLRGEENNDEDESLHNNDDSHIKQEQQLEQEDLTLNYTQEEHTIKPKRKKKKCVKVVDDLLRSLEPLVKKIDNKDQMRESHFWFFGKHVTERLNNMREEDANMAGLDIIRLLDEWPNMT